MAAETPQKLALVVDDEPDIRTITRLSLSSFGGWDVVEAHSGVEALKLLESGTRPDLILLDMLLPEMDGLQILKAIRTLPIGQGIPVIFLTATSRQQELEQLYTEGAIGFIRKPFDPVNLPGEIVRILNQSTRAPQNGKQAKIEELRARYIKLLPERLKQLEDALNDSTFQRSRLNDPSSDTSSAFAKSIHIAHQIHGTAGTHGLREISDAAGELEVLLHSSQPLNQSDVSRQVEEIVERLQTLQRAVQAAYDSVS